MNQPTRKTQYIEGDRIYGSIRLAQKLTPVIPQFDIIVDNLLMVKITGDKYDEWFVMTRDVYESCGDSIYEFVIFDSFLSHGVSSSLLPVKKLNCLEIVECMHTCV